MDFAETDAGNRQLVISEAQVITKATVVEAQELGLSSWLHELDPKWAAFRQRKSVLRAGWTKCSPV